MKVEIRTKKTFSTVGEACMAIYSQPLQALKVSRKLVSSWFSTDGTEISASALPYYGFSETSP